jgi:hypothetical protein
MLAFPKPQVFDQIEWRKHQKRSRFVRNIRNMFKSRVLQNVFWTVAFVAAVAAAAAFLYTSTFMQV